MANINKKTTNSFSKGLIMDFSPEKTGNEVLTHALNATLLTFNGNEMSLQNDMGNARVETAFLPEGYVPVGSCEFGDIIYVVSYNPLIDKAQIGCFPSPERNISSEELGQNPVIISSSEFQEMTEDKPTGKIITSSVKKIIFSNDMHPGDQYVIYQESLDALSKSPISDYGNSDHEISEFPKLVKINVVSIEDSGKINYLNSSVKWYDNDYFILDSFNAQGVKKDIDSYRTITNSAYATFASKVSGKLALLIELEKITGFSCTWECFLPKSLEYTPWVYTGYDKIEDLQPNISDLNIDNLWINHKSDDENVVNVIYTNTTCQQGDSLYEIDYPYSFKGIVPDKGISDSIDKLYKANQTYTFETEETLRILPSNKFIKKYEVGDTITINSSKVTIETPFVWVQNRENGLVYLCALASSQIQGFPYQGGTTTLCRGYIPIKTPMSTPVKPSEAVEARLNNIFKDFITKYYEIYGHTTYTFNDISYNLDSYTALDGVYSIWGYFEYWSDQDSCYYAATPMNSQSIDKAWSIKFKHKKEFKTYSHSFIEFKNRLYVNTKYILTLDSISKQQIEDDNYLLFRNTPIYMNFNWTTNDKNINPKYALLEKSEWGKNSGEFKIYTVNGNDISTQSKYINDYNNITAYNTISRSGKYWNFSRIYHPENNITYNQFKEEYNYETAVTKFINETLLLAGGKKIFSSIKNIIRSVDGSLNVPNEGYYYLNACNYYSNTVNGFQEYYEALQDVDGDVVLEIPKKIQITHHNIKDDIINNTFKYPVLKKFEDFKIPIQQEINGEIINLDQSNFVYNYEITPAMPYGKLDELKISGSIDFSKIGLTDINITKWKYYNTDTHLTLTWGMDAYTEPGKGIPEIIFEFYDNQGLAAAYHVSNYSSFNGQFTDYLTLNQNQGTPGLNNLNWKGEEFFHMKKAIPREQASNDNTYYYESDKTYTKVNNLEELPANITTLFESDAGTLYSNWLYGVKIIVRYEYKNALGNYIYNDNPIIFYRWLWTNTLFNKHYYNIDDFKSLQFSLNLDMNVDYSIIQDQWNLQSTKYQAEQILEQQLSEDELTGATIQHINTDQSKNNVKVNITPGLLDTFNTFTLCSKRAQSEQNPLNDIEVSVILGDQQLVNYPEQPIVKQYSGQSYPLDSNLLEPKVASSLTGLPDYVGPGLSSILGVNQSSEDALDLYSRGRDINKFTNNFCLYNRSYINTELEQSINFSIDLSGIQVSQSPANLYTLRTNVQPETIKPLPDDREDFIGGENQTSPTSYITKRRTRYFSSGTILNPAKLQTYKDAIQAQISDPKLSIEQDLVTSVIEVTITDVATTSITGEESSQPVTVQLTSAPVYSLDKYIYKISRTYEENSYGIRESSNKAFIYDEGPVLYNTPVVNPDNSTVPVKLFTYCFGNDTSTWNIYSSTAGLEDITNAADYKYRWEYDILYVPASTKEQAQADPIYQKSDTQQYIPIKYYYESDGIYYIYDRDSDIEGIFKEFTYTRDEVLLSRTEQTFEVPVNNGTTNTTSIKGTVMIIPIKCDINPSLISTGLISLTLEAETQYYINSNSNASIYYLTKEKYDAIREENAYINYFTGKQGGTSWISELANVTDNIEFPDETQIYLYAIGDPGTKGTIQIYRRVPDYITNSFSYYDANNNFKTINNYQEFKFNSSTNNLTTLMSEGLDLALSGLHYSKFKQYTTTLKDQEVKVVRPYVYHVRDLDYNNLQLVNSNTIAFKNMLFFSADSRHNSYTDIMGTIHKINKYTEDKNLNMTRVTNLRSLSAGNTGNISCVRMFDWCDPLRENGIYNFFPIGWGTLTDEDKKRIDTFKRSSVTVKLQGMAAEDHISVSSTATIGSYIRSSSDYINIADHWRNQGALLHAQDVLALLTQVYYLQDNSITTDVQAINDYAYLENNYCVYSRDIIVSIKPFEYIENCNHMITLRGIDYQEYIDAIINNQNFSQDIDMCNVTCMLDSIMKVAPIGFKFNYVMPNINLSENSKKYYRVYKVSLDEDRPYVILEGQNLQYRTPYVIGSSGSLINAYGASTINTYNKIALSKISPATNNPLYYEEDGTKITTRLYITNLGASTLGVNSILQNLKHDETIDGVPIPLLTFTGTIDNKYSWNLYSSAQHKGVYITDLPCNYSENSYKYFT